MSSWWKMGWLLFALVAMERSVLAERPPRGEIRKQQMRDDMETYFGLEVRAGTVFMGIGTGSVIIGATLLTQPGTGRGAGYPILGVGLLQIAVGARLWMRTEAQVAALNRLLSENPEAFRRQELARMRRVSFTFQVLRYSELTLLAGGIAMASAGGARRLDTLKGIGLGVIVQSAATLVLDFFAERRAHEYMRSLQRFQVSVDDGSQWRSLGLSYNRRF